MNIRLIGSPDLVRRWKSMLDEILATHGMEYPSRGGDKLRVYFEIDDRFAEVAMDRFEEQQRVAGIVPTKGKALES